jgi:hypothetical protein
MTYRTTASIALLAALIAAPTLCAQSPAFESTPLLSLSVPEENTFVLSPPPQPPLPETIVAPPKSSPVLSATGKSSRFAKVQFIFLSTCVYGAATADMYQTTQYRNYSWWRETDPFARPFAHLPTPAYYATGLALATGLNWFSWKMAHSRRFHRLAPIPQLATIAGNLHGVDTNIH